MKEKTEPTETETSSRKTELIIGSIVVVAVIAIVATIAFLISNSGPKIVYEPTNACEVLSANEAGELFGTTAVASGTAEPVISGDTATSKCGYTDGNSDMNAIIVAAVVIRSGINDKGVEQNKTEFEAGTPTTGIQTIDGLGERAYFNETTGQLNVLDGYDWYLLSYGPGSDALLNTPEDAIKLAQKVLNS